MIYICLFIIIFFQPSTSMKKFWIILLLLIPVSAVAQEISGEEPEEPAEELADTSIVEVPPPYKFRLAVHGGYGYRFGRIPKSVSADEAQYLKGLKHGPYFGADASWFFKPDLGAGVRVSNLRGVSSAYVELTYENGTRKKGKLMDSVDILFVGPQLTARRISKTGNGCFFITACLGYMRYMDSQKIVDTNQRMVGNTVGYGFDIGYDLRLAQWLWLGAQISGLTSSIRAVTVDDGTKKQNIILDSDEKESLTHISVSAGIRICL